MGLTILDNGGRRIGIERRVFSYAYHIPERRSGKGRRSWVDRRVERNNYEIGFERRGTFKSFFSRGAEPKYQTA